MQTYQSHRSSEGPPSAPTATRARTLPDRIADELIARIFVGELPAGATLPPERRLAQELGVDRTSLRIALGQLARLGVLRSVRGSGITVLDYRERAGVDFLAAVLDIPGIELGSTFLLEALTHWNHAMPYVVARAFERATPAWIQEIDALFNEQLRRFDAGAELDDIAEIETDIQDLIVGMHGDVTLRLVANSTRELRRRLTRVHLSLVDVRAQIEMQRAQARLALGPCITRDEQRAAHAAYLNQHHERLRQHLASLPPNPRRTAVWPRQPTGAPSPTTPP